MNYRERECTPRLLAFLRVSRLNAPAGIDYSWEMCYDAGAIPFFIAYHIPAEKGMLKSAESMKKREGKTDGPAF